MKKNLIACVLLTLCLFSCQRQKLNQKDLVQNISYAEKQSDTQVILFGTPGGKMQIGSGWWPDSEFDHGFQYRWIVAPKAEFVFYQKTPAPVYLHLQLKSFYSNPAEVYVNQNLISKIDVNTAKQVFTMPLASEVLLPGLNHVELRFAEVRMPREKATDLRELAAAAYFAIITPSKYLTDPEAHDVQTEFWNTDRILIGSKTYPAINYRQGGSVRFFEILNQNPVLKFGYYFEPQAFAENDDFARFSITLCREAQERVIFEKRLTDRGLGFEQIDLSKYLSKKDDSIYEIAFQIQRNSIFDKGETAWIEPSLMQQISKRQKQFPDNSLTQVRSLNRNANVIVVVLDAGAAKHYSTYGYFRKTTPVIDQLAREGIQFNSAYTQAVYTLASTASLMTGLYPFHHRVLYLNSKLPPDSKTMARSFDEGGYATGTFIANGNASSTFGLTQGFSQVAEVFREKRYTGWGQDVTDRFSGWVDKNRARPFFAYLHYREPHAPFRPPREWIAKFTDPNYRDPIGMSMITARNYDIRQDINIGKVKASNADLDFITALYDGNLAYGDFQIGLVIKKLKDLGIYDDTVIIVTSDHGEAFWEHGYSGHNVQLYQESMHIPLVIKLAHSKSGAYAAIPKTINSNVRTIDLFPTLVDLLGFSRRGLKLDGKSYLSYLAGAPEDGRLVVSQTIAERSFAYLGHNKKFIADVAYRKDLFPAVLGSSAETPGSLKIPIRTEEPFLRLRIADLLTILPVDLVFQKRQELYDLKTDPMELKNRFENKLTEAGFCRTQLFEPLDESRVLNQKVGTAVMDESTRENLRTLGYIGQDSNE